MKFDTLKFSGEPHYCITDHDGLVLDNSFANPVKVGFMIKQAKAHDELVAALKACRELASHANDGVAYNIADAALTAAGAV